MEAVDIRGVIFDLDGTLLNTLDDLAGAMNYVLQRCKLPVHPVDAYRYFIGDGVDMLVKRVLPSSAQDDKTFKRVKDAFIKRYQEYWCVKTTPYDGIEEMFDALHEKNLFLAILSNKPHLITNETVRHFFGTRHFTACIGYGIFPKKPDPEAALYIASSMGIAPEKCLYVGDTGTDMQTAAAAGMPRVGVLWGFREENELWENGAQWVVSWPSEVVDIIGSSVLVA